MDAPGGGPSLRGKVVHGDLSGEICYTLKPMEAESNRRSDHKLLAKVQQLVCEGICKCLDAADISLAAATGG